MKFAVIEDDRSTSLLYTGWLKQRIGASVTTWSSLNEALEGIAGGVYDLFVVDDELGTERHGGLRFVASARKAGISTPVLMVPGSGLLFDDELLRHFGIARVLQKPVSEKEFAAATAEILLDK